MTKPRRNSKPEDRIRNEVIVDAYNAEEQDGANRPYFAQFVHSWRRTMRGLRTVLKEKLLSFYTHVGEFSKILIEGGHWRFFGRSGCRY
jgi:hypothetical protein